MDYERIADGLAGAEGPLLLPDGVVACLETLGGALTRIGQDSPVRLAEPGGGPNGAALGPDGRCYVCNNGGLSPGDLVRLRQGLPVEGRRPFGSIQAIDLASGSVTTLYEASDGAPLISPNDLVFDAHGGFYFTDYNDIGRFEPLPGLVHYATADGRSIRRASVPLERPNGVGLSPDGASLYVAETASGRLLRFTIVGSGELAAGETLFHDPALGPDSLAVQADGSVCVACPGANLILRVAPDGSSERIATPPGGPTNICFGGVDGRTAFVTMMFAGEVHRARWDSPGLRLQFQPD